MKVSSLVFGAAVTFLVAGCTATADKPVESVDESSDNRIDYLAVGDWRLFDTREEIQANEYLPGLKPVRVTGGLETSQANFNGEQTNVSFAFDDQGLQYAQVWLYEGHDLELAASEFGKLFEYFEENLSGAVIHGVSADEGLTAQTVEAVVAQLHNSVKESLEAANEESGDNVTHVMKLDMIPEIQPAGNRLHGQLVYSGKHEAFYVFLFEDRPDAHDRTAREAVTLIEEKE